MNSRFNSAMRSHRIATTLLVCSSLTLLSSCGGSSSDGNQGGLSGYFLTSGSFGLPIKSKDGLSWTEGGSSVPQSSYWELAASSDTVSISGPESTTLGGKISRFNNFPNIVESVAGPFMRAMTYGDGLYVGATDDGEIYSSTDGLTYALATNIALNSPSEMIYGNGEFVVTDLSETAPGTPHVVFVSENASEWQAITPPDVDLISDVYYSDGTYVFVGVDNSEKNTLWKTTDFSDWEQLPMGYEDYAQPRVVAFHGQIIAALSYSSNVYGWYSDNGGTSWTVAAKFTALGMRDMATDGSRFVAVENSGLIAVSTDGSEWQIDNPYGDSLYDIEYIP